jgi:tripartite-type tricarboxylate transporter receptor subunit TctC
LSFETTCHTAWTLREAIRKAVASAEFTSVMEKLKTPIAYLDAPEFRDFLAKDAAMLRKAVEQIGKVE